MRNINIHQFDYFVTIVTIVYNNKNNNQYAWRLFSTDNNIFLIFVFSFLYSFNTSIFWFLYLFGFVFSFLTFFIFFIFSHFSIKLTITIMMINNDMEIDSSFISPVQDSKSNFWRQYSNIYSNSDHKFVNSHSKHRMLYKTPPNWFKTYRHVSFTVIIIIIVNSINIHYLYY